MKRFVVGLSLLIIFGLLVAACAPAAPETGAAESADEAAAAGDLTDITYTYVGPIPEDVGMVQDAMNEILNEKIGVNLTLEPIDWGAYNDKMQLRLAAGEECDIIFTAPWINSYANNVSNGNLIPLDDLLPEYAPGLWASMPESTWDAARVNGKIYGVINQQIFPKPWGIHPRKDLAEKYGLDMDAIQKWEDLEPWLAAVRDGEGITPVYLNMETASSSTPGLWRSQYYGYDPLDDGIGAIVMKADDPNHTVVSTLELPEFREASALAARWIEEGFLPLELQSRDEGDASFRAGLYAMGYHVEKPGNEVEAQDRFGFEFLRKNLTDPLILDTAGATSTLNGICATSQHPVEAMKVLEEFNTNPVVYNLLARGIEGVHWVWADEASKVVGFPEGVDGSTSSYNPNTDWEFGNQFNAYYRDAAQVGAWEETLEMNNSAMPSTALGFTVDRTPIETEIAQVNAVWAEYGVPIGNGWISVDGNADEGVEKLKEAGLDTIIAEVQRQLDEWAKVNNK